MHKKMLVILDCCIGCHACQIACRQENDLVYESNSKWCDVITIRPRYVENQLHLDFFPIMCIQCSDPLCVKICPTEAVMQRDDGIVIVNGKRCNGCKLCVDACPLGAMCLNEVTKVANKCNFCLERLEYGIEPSCVQHCIGGALRYTTQDDLEKLAQGKHSITLGKVCYVSSKWRLSSIELIQSGCVKFDER